MVFTEFGYVIVCAPRLKAQEIIKHKTKILFIRIAILAKDRNLFSFDEKNYL
jgi:hypothetical protein